jgi:hypothetical protein
MHGRDDRAAKEVDSDRAYMPSTKQVCNKLSQFQLGANK